MILPTNIDPPGRHAPRRPTRAQLEAVRRIAEEHQREVARLTNEEMEALWPVFDQAERELRERLKEWTERAPDGELRWTAHKYRSALAHLEHSRRAMAEALGVVLTATEAKAQAMALRHLEDEVARFSAVFGNPVRLPIGAAKQIAMGKSFIIDRVRSSTLRYAGQVGRDIQRRLAVDMLTGQSVYQTVERLRREGGPRGLVALRGVAGEPGSYVEDIPEGLFARYRHWAERVVRTETTSAYGARKREGMEAASSRLPGLKRKWVGDPSSCALICRPLDGMVVGIHDLFPTRRGGIEHEPAHPNCECSTVPWMDSWGQELRGLDPAFEDIKPAGAGSGGGMDYKQWKPSNRMVAQEQPMSCGAACARQLLADAGIDITEAEIRELAGTSWTGTDAGQLARALNRVHPGGDYRGGSPSNVTSPTETLRALAENGPFIAFTRTAHGLHSVIVDGIEDGLVKIRDPWGASGFGGGQGIEGVVELNQFLDYWKSGIHQVVFDAERESH